MKLKEKLAFIGVIGLSNVTLLGMTAINQSEVLNNGLQQMQQKVVEIQGGYYTLEDEITKMDERLSEIEKQPTSDNTVNDIEDTVELKPVKEQPVVKTPQQIQEKEKPKESPSYKEVNVRVSFYTSLASENGGYAGMNAINGKLKLGSISAPKGVPFGSIISIPKMQSYLGITDFKVDDRGGAIYIRDDGTYKLDVYVPRKQGESDTEYFNRVNNMGIVNTKAKIYFK